jgi:hypothetical protein
MRGSEEIHPRESEEFCGGEKACISLGINILERSDESINQSILKK